MESYAKRMKKMNANNKKSNNTYVSKPIEILNVLSEIMDERLKAGKKWDVIDQILVLKTLVDKQEKYSTKFIKDFVIAIEKEFSL